MENRTDRLDLTLNTQEVIVLFFVMVALFTGLLFFGYRVGYMHSTSAADTRALPLTPAAPADESPRAEPNSREVEAEPEIRLENRPWNLPGHGPGVPPELGDPDVETGRFLAHAVASESETLPEQRATSHELEPSRLMDKRILRAAAC